MSPHDNIEKLVQQKLAEQSVPYEEGAWEAAAPVIEQLYAKRKRRRRLLLLLFLLLFSVGAGSLYWGGGEVLSSKVLGSRLSSSSSSNTSSISPLSSTNVEREEQIALSDLKEVSGGVREEANATEENVEVGSQAQEVAVLGQKDQFALQKTVKQLNMTKEEDLGKNGSQEEEIAIDDEQAKEVQVKKEVLDGMGMLPLGYDFPDPTNRISGRKFAKAPRSWRLYVTLGVDRYREFDVERVAGPTAMWSPSAGIGVSYPLSGRIRLATGLSYQERKGINRQVESIATTFGFFRSEDRLTLRPMRLHYLAVPLELHYQVLPRHRFIAGANVTYLLTTTSELSQRAFTSFGAENPTTSTEMGYMEGFSTFDYQLKVGYAIRLAPRWEVSLHYLKGFRDLVDNDYFGHTSEDINSRWGVGLQYYLR